MKAINKMSNAEIRMMLNFLGIKLGEQPATMKEMRALINAYKKRDIELYSNAYTFVVEQKPVEGAIEKVIPIDQARDLVVGEINIIKESALSQLESIFKKDGQKVLDDITEAFSKAVETESKKFNTVKHVVYVGNKKEKEIKGVLCEEFETILQLSKERVNVLMVGPSGCGKTHVTSQLAEAMNLKYASQSCSAGVSESAFTGKLLPLGKSGQFEYVESDFVRIYENGGVFLFDEIDAADSNVMVFLNQALANDGFHCSQRIKKTYIKKHKNFVAVAAANTFGQGADSLYTGRNSLDAATLDRFRIGTVVMDYSAIVEEKLIDEIILKFGREIRQRISNHKLKKILSTRFMLDATKMKNGQKWSMDKIQDMYFADWSREEIAVIGGKLAFEIAVEEKLVVEKVSDENETPLPKTLSAESLIEIGGKEWRKEDKHIIYFNKDDSKNPSAYYDCNIGRFYNAGMSSTDYNNFLLSVKEQIDCPF